MKAMTADIEIVLLLSRSSVGQSRTIPSSGARIRTISMGLSCRTMLHLWAGQDVKEAMLDALEMIWVKFDKAQWDEVRFPDEN